MSDIIQVTGGPGANEATITLPGRTLSHGVSHVSLLSPGCLAEPVRCPATTSGTGVTIRLLPNVAGKFEPGNAYELILSELEVTGHVLDWPTLPVRALPSFRPEEPAIATPVAPTPEFKPDIPTAAPEQTPVMEVVSRAKRRPHWVLPVITSTVLFIMLAGGVFWWFFIHHRPGYGFPPLPAPPRMASVPSSHNSSSTGTGTQADPLDHLSVQDVIAQAGSPAAIGGEGSHRLTSGRADDGVLLLEAAASRGDAPSMSRLAHLYDPIGFDPHGPIPSPDLRESAQYYQKAANAGDTSVAPARAALHAHLVTAAASGDETAATALKDFWP